jgi:hypothetical protein
MTRTANAIVQSTGKPGRQLPMQNDCACMPTTIRDYPAHIPSRDDLPAVSTGRRRPCRGTARPQRPPSPAPTEGIEWTNGAIAGEHAAAGARPDKAGHDHSRSNECRAGAESGNDRGDGTEREVSVALAPDSYYVGRPPIVCQNRGAPTGFGGRRTPQERSAR